MTYFKTLYLNQFLPCMAWEWETRLASTNLMNKIVIVCFLLASGLVTAQKITISAKVVDIGTKEPLIFATVGIAGKPIGTISNMQGDFDFYIPAEYRNDILVISILGYTNYETPVWILLNTKNFVIG